MMTTDKQAESDELMTLYGEALRSGYVRLEFGFAFPLDGTGTRQTITVHTKNERGRWVATKPYLVGDPSETRADLLEQMAAIYRQTGIEPAATLEDLHLTVRTYNCLKREGINTVADLVAHIKAHPEGLDGLMDIRNFGQKCVFEIAATLREGRVKL